MRTEIEKMLRKEILRIESENESLKERLKLADEMNRKIYKENHALNLYVSALERLRAVGIE